MPKLVRVIRGSSTRELDPELLKKYRVFKVKRPLVQTFVRECLSPYIPFSRDVYVACLRDHADNERLVAKLKKVGYDNELCCLRCSETAYGDDGTIRILGRVSDDGCSVEGRTLECIHCGCSM